MRLFKYFQNAVFMPLTRKITYQFYNFAKINGNFHFSGIFLDLERRFYFFSKNASKNAFLGHKRRKSWKSHNFCSYFLYLDSFNSLQVKWNKNNQIYSIWVLLYRSEGGIIFLPKILLCSYLNHSFLIPNCDWTWARWNITFIVGLKQLNYYTIRGKKQYLSRFSFSEISPN